MRRRARPGADVAPTAAPGVPAPAFSTGVRRAAYALCFAIAALGLALGRVPWWGDAVDRPRLTAVGLGALGWFALLARVPWGRLPDWALVIEPLTTVVLTALGIAATGGPESPLNACYPLIIVLAALYHHQLGRALAVGAAVGLANLAPLLAPGPAAGAAPRLLAFSVCYFLGALACALLGRELLRAERAQARVLALAARDGLTGALSRQALEERLDAALAPPGAPAGEVAILFLDLDHFKAVNDGYGHATGDRVLRDLCARIAPLLPVAGALGRYGGEEFVAVLPGTPPGEAVRVAEAVRARGRRHTLPRPGGGAAPPHDQRRGGDGPPGRRRPARPPAPRRHRPLPGETRRPRPGGGRRRGSGGDRRRRFRARGHHGRGRSVMAVRRVRSGSNGCSDNAAGGNDFCPGDPPLRHQLVALIARAMAG